MFFALILMCPKQVFIWLEIGHLAQAYCLEAKPAQVKYENRDRVNNVIGETDGRLCIMSDKHRADTLLTDEGSTLEAHDVSAVGCLAFWENDQWVDIAVRLFDRVLTVDYALHDTLLRICASGAVDHERVQHFADGAHYRE